MTETEFTKGPWEKDNEYNIVGKNGTKVVIYGCSLSSKEHLANNNLIAVAPEMYEMLEALINELGMTIDKINTMRDTEAAGKLVPVTYWSKESCHDGQVLLAKARGEFPEEKINPKVVAAAFEIYSVMQKFVDSTDKGQVRSKAAYEEFNSILNKLNDNHAFTRNKL
jgi:hypothetical protein